MEIGLVYSSKDPRQKKARDFVKSFIQEHGLLAEFAETDRPVNSPTLIIDGIALREQRKQKRDVQSKMFPDINDMAKLLEYHTWCL